MSGLTRENANPSAGDRGLGIIADSANRLSNFVVDGP